jgi:hypothetical protein
VGSSTFRIFSSNKLDYKLNKPDDFSARGAKSHSRNVEGARFPLTENPVLGTWLPEPCGGLVCWQIRCVQTRGSVRMRKRAVPI